MLFKVVVDLFKVVQCEHVSVCGACFSLMILLVVPPLLLQMEFMELVGTGGTLRGFVIAMFTAVGSETCSQLLSFYNVCSVFVYD